MLLLLPQRYKFSSKSQLMTGTEDQWNSCCCYRKGTNFQANHNCKRWAKRCMYVVVATAKVQIFKQITTHLHALVGSLRLLLLPQRYKFSSKSQLSLDILFMAYVVVATAKVQIFKQITTVVCAVNALNVLLLLPQRYKFSSKSQLAHG